MALGAMAHQAAAGEVSFESPLAPKPTHFPARAKRVIFLFMSGGPSQYDTFNYRPELQRHSGKAVGAAAREGLKHPPRGDFLTGSPFQFAQHGEGGLWISELFPHLAKQADKLCVINSMHCDSPAHIPACQQIHTGQPTFIRPSMGAWTLYGLGTENQSLPGYVSIGQLGRGGGPVNLGSAFLPAAYQATSVASSGAGPGIAFLDRGSVPAVVQQSQIRAIEELTQGLTKRTAPDNQIEGIIESYELAFRMQSVAPQVLDLSQETQATLDSYGIGNNRPTDQFGRSCLLARRMAEAGVRFIEVGDSGKWDHHSRLREELPAVCRATDQPIAALLADLEQRGMLDETLILWGGEFGREPSTKYRDQDGRDHNRYGYSMWLAGGGVRGGTTHGRTDDFGFEAVEGLVHTHDLHATMLHLLGLDHERLTFRHSGRDYRLTDVHGHVVREILA
jgi:hypothetical protein